MYSPPRHRGGEESINGKLECWNIGILGKDFRKGFLTIFPSFHHSIIPFARR
jgi:hypothetical protein